jgi:hypothetical protein
MKVGELILAHEPVFIRPRSFSSAARSRAVSVVDPEGGVCVGRWARHSVETAESLVEALKWHGKQGKPSRKGTCCQGIPRWKRETALTPSSF